MNAIPQRIRLQDAVCDEHVIFIDGIPIAIRPPDLDQASWHALCRHVCGHAPIHERLVHEVAVANDPAAWTRMEPYFDGLAKTDEDTQRSDPSVRAAKQKSLMRSNRLRSGVL